MESPILVQFSRKMLENLDEKTVLKNRSSWMTFGRLRVAKVPKMRAFGVDF